MWTNDISRKQLIAYSFVPNFDVRLPSGDNDTSLINLMILIEDNLGCIKEINISSVNIIKNINEVNNLINILQNPSNQIINNQFIQLLSSGNQNTIGQITSSLSNEFNQMNYENINNAISSKILFIYL